VDEIGEEGGVRRRQKDQREMVERGERRN